MSWVSNTRPSELNTIQLIQALAILSLDFHIDLKNKPLFSNMSYVNMNLIVGWALAHRNIMLVTVMGSQPILL